MKIKTSVIEEYVEDYFNNLDNLGNYKLKDSKVILITEEGNRIIVDYELEVYRQFNKNFIPNRGKIISGTLYLNLNELEVKRALILNTILNPD